MNNSLLLDNPSSLLRFRDSIYASDLLICAVAKIDIFTHFKCGPLSFKEICENAQIKERPTDVLISLLLSHKLINITDGKYTPTAHSLKYLSSNSPESLVPYYKSIAHRPQCMEFYEVLKTGKPSGWSSKKGGTDWLKSMQDKEFANSFTAAMDSRGSFLAKALAEKFEIGQHKSLLDIAGGSGIYACSIAKRNNSINTAVLEIPPVDLAAMSSIQSKGMASTVKIISGDMFCSIPNGFDIHLFANAFHDWDYGSLKKIAANSYEALNQGGQIAVFDAHLNERKDGPLTIAEYSCLLMHSTEGKCYSTKEICEILGSVGFSKFAITDIAADRTLILAEKY